MNIYLHITTFANATHMIKGMKVCYRSKTSLIHLSSVLSLVLTLFLGFRGELTAQHPYKITKVVLDAGHGGKDPGCHGNSTKEKEIALSIILNLGKKIEAKYPDVEVIYTRKTDVFIPLNERAAIANRNKADLFISVHCNYLGPRNHATGSETYVLGLHRAEDNLAVAKRENASILLEDNYEKTYDGFDPYSTEGHIILSMFQNAHLQQSIQLATYVESAFKRMGRLPSRGVKQAGFLVIRETTMPSILIESGFLSTDTDENFLMKESAQNEVAESILKAFGNYKKDVEDQQKELEVATKEIEKIKPNLPDTDAVVVHIEGATQKTQTQPDPNQIAYRIQIAAASKPSLDKKYTSLDDLEVIKENDYYKFLVGNFSSYEAAQPRLSELKAKGFLGAFIVIYKDGQRVRAEILQNKS
ncbi:MAG: N-acetylmuramoyl-L-alanine amidase [Saprospiraceae bacterium]|uniref:N-acetylmuramoyl-L-alanine amidase n=1 Tax=Candidatus Opimibacter skivensis TaxID=2982028 RepID=A0A9D7SU35_9BACT|nr:N-acetylmuramoyl-L-alanine amidase [Candidatus Opimibacter skivensis]